MTSRIRFFLAISAFTLALAACQPAAEAPAPARDHAAADPHAAPQAAHDAHNAHVAPTTEQAHGAHGEAAPLPPPPAQRWATDAPLREGMGGIATAVAQAQAARQAGNFGAEQANALAATVDERFAFMLANCKLDPRADATLHTLLAQLVASAKRLQADPASADAMAHMQELLAAYPRYFDHPGWNAAHSG